MNAPTIPLDVTAAEDRLIRYLGIEGQSGQEKAIADDAPAVIHARRAAEAMGLKPTTVFSNGGLDANWLVQHGVPTITLGAGQHEIHTVNEYVDLAQYADGCRLAVMLAVLEG